MTKQQLVILCHVLHLRSFFLYRICISLVQKCLVLRNTGKELVSHCGQWCCCCQRDETFVLHSHCAWFSLSVWRYPQASSSFICWGKGGGAVGYQATRSKSDWSGLMWSRLSLLAKKEEEKQRQSETIDYRHKCPFGWWDLHKYSSKGLSSLVN